MLKAGATFARYRIDGRLGDGGMATVYRAFEPDLDRHVALKVLPSEFGQDKTFGARFDREAKLVAKLEHPNIIPIFAYGIEKGTPWMAMRLVGGGNLEALAGGRPLSPRRAVSIVEEVAEALDYAHLKGVIHRDVKPANILLDESGRVYLVDFGIARMKEGAQRLTQAGLVAGTPSYMAPEQAAGGELDARVDIYSLGVVAYEMLTGATPFRGNEPMEVLMKHISDPVPVPARGSIPEGMIEPLMRCLAKRPDDRWPTARAFATALQEGLEASSDYAADDFAPTMAMARPDFSATQPVERAYEPTVLSERPAAPVPSDSRPYEPTVFSPRPSSSATPSNGGPESRSYEPTVLSPRASPPPSSAGRPSDAGKPIEGANLRLAGAMVGLGLLLTLGGLGYWWWSGRAAESAVGPQSPHELAQAGATDLPVPPGPAPLADSQAAPEPKAETPADPQPVEPTPPEAAAEEPAPGAAKAAPPASPPSPRTQPRAASSPAPPPVKEAKPAISRAPRDDDDEPVGKQAGPSHAKSDPSPEPTAGEAVPESARTWTTARDVDRIAPLRLDRSVDLGVRVSGVPVDRVFITARDARAGIKKLFRKSTDKKRFTAEFLLNCPKDGSRPRLSFEVEVLREEGGVLERFSEKKNCEGHVKVSGDIAVANLEDARKIRVRVRPAG